MHGHQITPIKIVIFGCDIDMYIASYITGQVYTTWLLFPSRPSSQHLHHSTYIHTPMLFMCQRKEAVCRLVPEVEVTLIP